MNPGGMLLPTVEGLTVPWPEPEPPGYSELCAKLRNEADSVGFQTVLEEIYRLLAECEKCKDGDLTRVS